MDIYSKSDNAILLDIGTKIKDARLKQNITQKELCNLSGVSTRRISDIENGLNHSIISTIAILRALSMLDYFERFTEERKISPLEAAKLFEGRKLRQRSSSKNNKGENKEEEVEW